MRGLLLALLLGGCAPSHLELAKGHRQVALDAQAAGDTLTARGEMQAAITEAEASLKDEEGAEAQAWILKAWGHLALGQEEQVRPALREARQRHRGGAPAWQQRVLIAAHCQLALDDQWFHYAALCFDHLLGAPGDEGLRVFATEGLANADAQRKPGYAALFAYGDPLFTRVAGAARQSPMDVDLLAILANRLSRFCGDAAFTDQIEGWRQVRDDLLRAAKGLGGFTSEDRRLSFERDFERAQKVPLCPRVGGPPGQ
ncbi:MAG: hypothetical protein KC549_09670 [Myxococcales bacterium]|nr:hypothetical protein [Myxococcales bacterium]MCB9548103.1 hypothetical protein [Myxococcales bacterium]